MIEPNEITSMTSHQEACLAQAEQMMENGHELGAVVLYIEAGFPEIGQMIVEEIQEDSE